MLGLGDLIETRRHHGERSSEAGIATVHGGPAIATQYDTDEGI